MKTTIIIERLQSALIGILFVSIFLPFGLNHFGWTRLVYLAGIGLTIAFSVLTSELIVDKVFKMPNDVSKGINYIIRRNILFEVINIMFTCLLIMLFLDRFVNNDIVDNHFGWATFFSVFAVNCWTSVVIHFYWRNVYKRRYLIRQLEEAQLLNGMLQERQRNAMPDEREEMKEEAKASAAGDHRVVITGATKESLAIRPRDFIYATSEGNYVHLFYTDQGQAKDMLIRTSMKSAIESLCIPDSSIMQCHRAFIVNLQKVEKVEGRSSGIALLMQHTGDTVLVSKQYAANVKERIKHPA